MVERQPADHHVVASHPDGLPDGLHVGEQVAVRESDTLGIAGAARGVLNESQILTVDLDGIEVDVCGCRFASVFGKTRRGGDGPEALDFGAE